MPDEGKKKKSKKLAPKGTRERAQQMHDATDYNKKARAVNAKQGTKLAKKGSEMRDKQDEYAMRKQGSISSSADRGPRLAQEAKNMKETRQMHINNSKSYTDDASKSTFSNKSHTNISKRYNK
jgi:hypothetical protein